MSNVDKIENELDLAESDLDAALDELKRTGDIVVVLEVMKAAESHLVEAQRLERN